MGDGANMGESGSGSNIGHHEGEGLDHHGGGGENGIDLVS